MIYLPNNDGLRGKKQTKSKELFKRFANLFAKNDPNELRTKQKNKAINSQFNRF